MSRLTEAQQTRLDELLAIHVPASVTRSPEEHERGKHFVRPFARQQRLTLVKENVRALKTDWRRVEAEIRWDDQCSNGYNSFSITGSGWEKGRRMDPQNPDWCGSCHDLLAAVFPQLRRLIKYHGIGSKGPTHYVANTLYHADEHGPTSQWVYLHIESLNKDECLTYTRIGSDEENTLIEEFGRDRLIFNVDEKTAKIANLDHARASAMWPDATDEQLRDADQLIERIPLLVGTFKQELEEFATDHNWEGFTY